MAAIFVDSDIRSQLDCHEINPARLWGTVNSRMLKQLTSEPRKGIPRSANVSKVTGNCLIAKGPTSHMLADFFIMTSESNGPTNSCTIVTSQ